MLCPGGFWHDSPPIDNDSSCHAAILHFSKDRRRMLHLDRAYIHLDDASFGKTYRLDMEKTVLGHWTCSPSC